MSKQRRKILLSFLGTGGYVKTRYEFNPEQSGVNEASVQEGTFTAICMARVWQPDNILLFATSKAKSNNEDKFSEEAHGLPVEWIEIPEGRNKEELLEILSMLNQRVPSGSEIVVDVTHGFRSLPIIGVAAVYYLSFIKEVEVRHIWYGAYTSSQERLASVIDLRVFSEIIDWLWAVRVFKETGETKPLAEVLKPYQKQLYEKQKEDPKVQKIASRLERLGPLIAGVQVLALQQQAAKAYEALQEALDRGKLGEVRLLLPGVIDSIKDKVEQLRVRCDIEATVEEKAFAQIKAQYALLLAYLDWERPAQAIILFREWLVNVALYILGGYEGILLEKDKLKEALKLRNATEGLLNSGRVMGLEGKKAEKFHRLMRIWDSLIQKRNAIAHAGMNAEGYNQHTLGEADLNKLRSEAEEAYNIVQEIRNYSKSNSSSAANSQNNPGLSTP